MNGTNWHSWWYIDRWNSFGIMGNLRFVWVRQLGRTLSRTTAKGIGETYSWSYEMTQMRFRREVEQSTFIACDRFDCSSSLPILVVPATKNLQYHVNNVSTWRQLFRYFILDMIRSVMQRKDVAISHQVREATCLHLRVGHNRPFKRHRITT